MRKFFLQFGLTVVISLGAIAGFIMVIDPFYKYHEPVLNTTPYLYSQIYQTPGLARNFQYDSTIIGTSMMENFRGSWFQENGYKTVKLCYAGGRTKDIQTVMEIALESHPGLSFIWTDLEEYQLLLEPQSRYQELPQYLYQKNFLRDYQYWWNSDVFWQANARVLEANMGVTHNIDDAYTWEDPELFSKEKVLNQYREEISDSAWHVSDENQSIFLEDKLELVRENIANYLPSIVSHPNTEFIFFFPPYSAIYWERKVLEGDFEVLEVYQYAAELLLAHDNVRVFYFQDEFDWITNLDNYRDDCHHSPIYNRYIFDAIWNGEKELTLQNIDGYFEGMRDWLQTYDFEQLWDEGE